MRLLLAIVIIAAAAWAGYWFIGSSALRSGITAWFDARESEGWVADYSKISVQGFPNRFDTNLTDVDLRDPVSGLGWQAPFFQVFSLSYKPYHVIAVWPHEQRILAPEGAYKLSSTDMRASLVLEASTKFAPKRSTLTAENLAWVPENGPGAISAAVLTLAGERAGDNPETGDPRYHLGLVAEEVAPPAELLAQIDPNSTLARVIDSLNADFTVDFTAPWDRYAVEEARPQPTRIDVKHVAATWGTMTLEAAGSLIIDASGIPDGTITVKARNWRDMLKLAEASGALTPDLRTAAEQVLALMAGASGSDKSLDVPLKFTGGRIWLGPLPVADAPLMRLR